MRSVTLGLLLALVGSLAANAYFLVASLGGAHAFSDTQSVVRHMRDERQALRSLALRLANGEPHRAAFASVLRETSDEEPYDKEGWRGRYPLLARFEGDRLSDVCWTVAYADDGPPCSIDIIEASAPSEADQ